MMRQMPIICPRRFARCRGYELWATAYQVTRCVWSLLAVFWERTSTWSCSAVFIQSLAIYLSYALLDSTTQVLRS